MDKHTLKKLWQQEEKADFQGWDFSHLTGRWESEHLPWNYREIVLDHLNSTDQLLDMGTGGGEFLLSLHHPYHNTSVTEAWEPNIQLIEKQLAPLGIHIYTSENEEDIPCQDNMFDLIINQHAGMNISDIKRTLKPNGLFITKQVGADNNDTLSKRLIPEYQRPYPHNTLKQVVEDLKQADFQIEQQLEYFPYLRFYDVGAIVYYATIISWEFPGFSVERCFDTLYLLHKQIERQGYVQTNEHRFLIVAQNHKE
ncbi:class I SAM-dependent methyltransferase [Sporolactobacillus shoreicorticis]|uniref:Class I SAM-dependent methyltransferase n=1 Tax=Sporolactobacillus shoreicorticis TaxID=1923877 RepID=A0ABW5S1P2_9BACL|nr:methyltransferase domain-containing protein [Sporolactobacillus shoreicorticis]MCO7124568.1 class I SAM-dependent methyltransferase [Sporolactobacillus shoreicorticis]